MTGHAGNASPIDYPPIDEDTADTLRLILENVRRFLANVDEGRIDAAGALDEGTLAEARRAGLFGISLPEEYGGAGLGVTGYARIIQEVASESMSLAVTLGAHQGIGCKALLLYGTQAQKAKYLPKCATGEWVAALAMSEADAGSALALTRTRAVQLDSGKWVLSGAKTYITNGGLADVFTVLARALPVGKSTSAGAMTLFVVDRSSGVRSGPPMHKLGIRGSDTTEVFFDDLVLPEDSVLGRVGHGLKGAKDLLCYGRTTLCAGSTGACKTIGRLATRHALERRIGGTPISDFWMIKEKVAQMGMLAYAQDATTYFTTRLMDRVDRHFEETAMSKIFCSEALNVAANHGLQVAGGAGYISDYPYERLYRDARITPIFEGTNEVLRILVAVTGMRGARHRLERIRAAMGDGTAPPETLAPQRAILSRLVADLDAAIDRALTEFGYELQMLQPVQRRLADCHVFIYALAAVLSRACAAFGRLHADQWAVHHQLYAISFADHAELAVRRNLAELEQAGDLISDTAACAYESVGVTSDAVLDF